MKKDYLYDYGVTSIAQVFYYIGKFESAMIPKENDRLIRDVKMQLDTLGMKYEIVDFNSYHVGINLI